jgi:hypothetical protein
MPASMTYSKYPICLGVRLGLDDHSRLAAFAQAQGLTIAQAVRLIVRRAVQDVPTFLAQFAAKEGQDVAAPPAPLAAKEDQA